METVYRHVARASYHTKTKFSSPNLKVHILFCPEAGLKQVKAVKWHFNGNCLKNWG